VGGSLLVAVGLSVDDEFNHHLRRSGHGVVVCIVDRLMKDLGMNGVRRGKGIRTTVPRKDGARGG
jgi:putative transposase